MGADRWAKRASGLLVPNMNFGAVRPCPGCCAPSCPSSGCINNQRPQQLQAVITGIAGGSCDDCPDMNGTYILDRAGEVADCMGGYGPNCTWQYDLPAAICSSTVVQFYMFADGDGFYAELTVCRWSYASPYFWTNDNDRLDCLNLVDYPLTWAAQDGMACAYNPSPTPTCLMTAL